MRKISDSSEGITVFDGGAEESGGGVYFKSCASCDLSAGEEGESGNGVVGVSRIMPGSGKVACDGRCSTAAAELFR